MSSYIIVEIATILILSLIVLIPIAGFTARFALKPLIEVIAREQRENRRALQEGSTEARLLERVERLEKELGEVRAGVAFDHLLSSSGAAPVEEGPDLHEVPP